MIGQSIKAKDCNRFARLTTVHPSPIPKHKKSSKQSLPAAINKHIFYLTIDTKRNALFLEIRLIIYRQKNE